MMLTNLFGTDGIRGRVGEIPITPEWIMRIGYATGLVLARLSQHATVLVGKDTRVSGYMLEASLEAGLSAAGVDILLTGPLPTPGVAYLTRALRAQAGIVISASHNPYQDNGLKFFSGTGYKFDNTLTQQINQICTQASSVMPVAQLGKARRIDDAVGRYVEFCKSTFANWLNLRGLKIVLDCAHGASYHVAPAILHELGADVVVIGNQPDGFNINHDMGSTHPNALQQAVLAHQADLGIALDGDGDRVIMVDHHGHILNGDVLLYIMACRWQQAGHMKGGVVGTVMSNLALERAVCSLNVPFVRTHVGDNHILAELHKRQWQLGGESSGHLLFLNKHTSADGMITALQVLEAMLFSQKSLAELSNSLQLYPQTLINIPLTQKLDLNQPAIQECIAQAEQDLGVDGRVLLRPSGTEPTLRVMVEGKEKHTVQILAQRLAEEITAYIATMPQPLV